MSNPRYPITIDTPNCERLGVTTRLTRRITMAKGCGNEVDGDSLLTTYPATGHTAYRRAGTSKPLHAMRIVPSLVRQVKGSKGHLQPHKTCDTSNAGTCISSSNGRVADTQCGYRGREVVVPGGVTPTQGYGERPSRGKDLSRSRNQRRTWSTLGVYTLPLKIPILQGKVIGG